MCKSDCCLSFLPRNGYIISSACSFSLSRANKQQASNCDIIVLWLKGEANQRSKSVWKRRNCTDLPVCKPRLIVLSMFIQKKLLFFWLRVEILGAQPYRFILYQWRSRKGCLVTCLILLPFGPSHDVIETGHKIESLTIMILWLCFCFCLISVLLLLIPFLWTVVGSALTWGHSYG